jgi:hypothetical protein
MNLTNGIDMEASMTLAIEFINSHSYVWRGYVGPSTSAFN